MKKFLLPILIILLLWNGYRAIATKQDNLNTSVNTPPVESVNKINSLIINQSDSSVYNIPINPPVELDFLSKQDVFNLRNSYAALSPAFIPANYSPSDTVFGDITDNKPWLGLKGASYKGPGQNSIDGLSEESRFINNPLLLMGVGTSIVLKSKDIDGPEIYLKPISITVKPSEKTITAIYDFTSYESEVVNFVNANTSWDNTYNYKYCILEGINARDFGYDFAYAYYKKNISFQDPNNNLAVGVQRLYDLLHTGGSCGYSGDCNNASPIQPHLYFFVDTVPAQICMKLWKQRPQSVDSAADLYFIIIFQ